MDIAAASDISAGYRPLTFIQKPIVAVGLVVLADLVFFGQRPGATIGVYSLILLAFALAARPQAFRAGHSAVAAAGAMFFGLVLIEAPNLLAFALFWLAVTLTVLLPRTAVFDDGWRWARRLLRHALWMPVRPFSDLRRIGRAGERRPMGIARRAPVLVLPVLGTCLFLSLFAGANPLIGDALAGIDLLAPFAHLSIGRILFWLAVLVFVWSLLRPEPVVLPPKRAGVDSQPLPGVSVASVTLSLLAFNALFAIENGLDLAFLWSGAPLPEGVTLADYAHRGAYPLIATALLAGLFVLVTLRPGSAMAENRPIRRLVFVWIAQNVFLVASTVLRTIDYVEAYSLTRLRIAAFVWMGLVAVGLVLICVRLWRRNSGVWLINANLAAALILLGACSVVDLGSIAAHWNVRHTRQAGGRGANLDIAYLDQLGPSALSAMIEFESRTRNPALKTQVGAVRLTIMERLRQDQADWRGWTFRGARRLAEAEANVAAHGLAATRGALLNRDVLAKAALPLTAEPRP